MPILGIIASSLIKAIVDTFNRVTSGSLGVATSGQAWNATRGVWYANGTQAQSDAVASNYALASINLSPNATMNVDTTGGCGLAFWVTDSGSWWGAFPHYSSTVVTTCTGPDAYCYTAGCTPTDSCGTINQTTATTCTGPTVYCYTAGCTPTDSCGTITQTSSSTCTGPTVYCYTAGCTPANSCGTISQSTTTTCTGPTVSCTDTTNTCSPGGCGTVTVTSVVVSAYYAANDTDCTTVGATSVACSNCGLSGSIGPNCSPAPSYYCCYFPSYTQYTRTQNTDVINYTRSSASNVTTITRSSASNVTSYTRWSATNVNATTYTSAVRIISSVSGVVATDSTTTLATSTSARPIIASMQVNSSGNTLTVKGYSGAGQTTQLGSTITRTPTSPVKGNAVGLIKAPTTDAQGSTLENYSASN